MKDKLSRQKLVKKMGSFASKGKKKEWTGKPEINEEVEENKEVKKVKEKSKKQVSKEPKEKGKKQVIKNLKGKIKRRGKAGQQSIKEKKQTNVKPASGFKKKIDGLIENHPLIAKVFGIKIKLTGAFMIPVILIIILGVSSYQRASKTIVTNYRESTVNTVQKAGEYYTLLLTNLETKSQQFANDTVLVAYYSGTYSRKAADEASNFSSLQKTLLGDTLADENLFMVNVVASYGNALSSKGSFRLEDYDAFIETEEGQEIIDAKGKSVWSGEHSFIDSILGTTREEYAIAVNPENGNIIWTMIRPRYIFVNHSRLLLRKCLCFAVLLQRKLRRREMR